MVKTILKYSVSLFYLILFINIITIYYRNIFYSYNNDIFESSKKKLLFYYGKYNICYYNNSPLICGHEYEGYKKQKKGIYPSSVLVNLSVFNSIKEISHSSCYSRDIIIGVACAPHHFLERMSLRMGYKSFKNKLLLFFTGLSENNIINSKLYKENDLNNDIIIFNFISYYFNSSLLMILEMNWVKLRCKTFKYLIYHTPDVFLNYYIFYKEYVEEKEILYPVIAQKLIKNRVLRSNRSRFFVPFSVYNKTHYPPQPNGPLIVFSEKIIYTLLSAVNRINMPLWMDDVFLAFLLNETKITIHNLNNVISMYPIQIKALPNLSRIINKIVYIHSLPPGAVYYLLKSCSDYYFSK